MSSLLHGGGGGGGVRVSVLLFEHVPGARVNTDNYIFSLLIPRSRGPQPNENRDAALYERPRRFTEGVVTQAGVDMRAK